MKNNESVKRILVLFLGFVGLCMNTAVYAWFWFSTYYPIVSANRISVDGYNLGMCIGYDPSPYLEKYKLPEACEQVKQRLKEKLPKEIYEHIKNDKVDLLWDIYED